MRSSALRLRAITGMLALCLVAGACHSGTDNLTGSGGAENATDAARFIDMAQESLVQVCMEKAGFKYWPEPPPSSYKPGYKHSQWGNDDVRYAQAHGYGILDGTGQSSSYDPKADPNSRYYSSLSGPEQKQYDLVMDGPQSQRLSLRAPSGAEFSIPGRGCLANAWKEIYGSLETYFRLSVAGNQIEPQADKLVVADPAYVKAEAAWQQCMRSKNYNFQDAGDAYDAAEEAVRDAANKVSGKAAEVKIAVADAECGQQSRIVQTGNELLQKYWKQVEAKESGTVLAMQELQNKAVARAERILQGKGA